MQNKTSMYLLILVGAMSLGAQTLSLPDGDWRSEAAPPGPFAETVKKFDVSETEARVVALGAFPNLHARHAARVTGLLQLSDGDAILGKAGSYVWEVRVIDASRISGVVWVSAESKRTKLLYPR